jgi:hypothetical protein
MMNDAEDYALALGHVVISQNTVEAALLVLASRLWNCEALDDARRILGRRTFDERLSMLAEQLPKACADRHLADGIDRLLASIRQLSRQRNEAVHQLRFFNFTACGLTGEAPEPEADTLADIEELLELAQALDDGAERLVLAARQLEA